MKSKVVSKTVIERKSPPVVAWLKVRPMDRVLIRVRHFKRAFDLHADSDGSAARLYEDAKPYTGSFL